MARVRLVVSTRLLSAANDADESVIGERSTHQKPTPTWPESRRVPRPSEFVAGFSLWSCFFVLLWLPSFRGFSFGLVLLGLTASTRSFIVFGHPFFILAFLIGWFIKWIVSFG